MIENDEAYKYIEGTYREIRGGKRERKTDREKERQTERKKKDRKEERKKERVLRQDSDRDGN